MEEEGGSGGFGRREDKREWGVGCDGVGFGWILEDGGFGMM